MRWWDGGQWTEHVAHREQPPVPAAVLADSHVGAAPIAPTPPYVAPTPPYVMPATTAGYPGAYRPFEPDASAAVFGNAPAPRQSRAWIWWIVGGVVALGIVVGAVVLIAALLMGAIAQSDPSGSSGADGSADDTLSAADEIAAREAVELHDRAWRLGDCEDFFASTTQEYREYNQLDDCDSFYSASRSFIESVQFFTTVIRDVDAVDSAAAVSVTESYEWLYDEDGVHLDEPEPVEDRLDYMVVEIDGVWAIDDVFYD